MHLDLILYSLTGISQILHQKQHRCWTTRLRLTVIVVRLKLCSLVTLTNLVPPAITSACPNVVTKLYGPILVHVASAMVLSRAKPSVNHAHALIQLMVFVNLRTVVLKLCTDLVPVTKTLRQIEFKKGRFQTGPFFVPIYRFAAA
ncbi:hypothetical protein A8B75_07960 [Sphingomonadales bacterium EhC05]|nr:hypothetical protein A8B75_07960 [Sphingomonadales bacterium EhC05]